MNKLTFFLLFCLLGTSLTSCIEEIDITVPSPEIPVDVSEEEEPEVDISLFKIGRNSAQLAFAYVHTSPAPDGEAFRHHIVISKTEVLDGDDLRNDRGTATIAILVESANSSLAGEYKFSDGSFVDLGASMNYNISYGNYLLSGLNYDSESYVTISEQDDEYLIELSALKNGNPDYTARGSFSGPVTPVTPIVEESDEEIRPEDFAGVNVMTRGSESFPLSNAYLVSSGDQYKLFLSDQPVHNASELTGTSNVMLMYLSASSNGSIPTGRYEVSSRNPIGDGYFSTLALSLISSSYFCRNMNFTSNQADDDEPVDTGETLVRVDGDTFSIKFDFVSSRNGHIAGEYHGEILNINN